jgi:hypothetical protein
VDHPHAELGEGAEERHLLSRDLARGEESDRLCPVGVDDRPEAVDEGRSGWLVEERDFEALATAMKKLVRSTLAFREMGALASESVAANFEQREQIRQLESHYDEAIALTAAEERVVVPENEPIVSRAPARVRLDRPVAARNGSNGTTESTRLSEISVAK